MYRRFFFSAALVGVMAASAHAQYQVPNGGRLLPLPGDRFIPKPAKQERTLTPNMPARTKVTATNTIRDPKNIPLHIELPKQQYTQVEAEPEWTPQPTHSPIPVMNTPREFPSHREIEPHRKAFKPWYVGLKGEYATLDDYDGSGTSIDFDGGYGLGAFFGYRFTRMFRAELDMSYRDHDADSVTVGGTGFGSSGLGFESLSVMANAYLDMPIEALPVVTPYIGAGLGHLWQLNGAEENATAYQVMTGLTFNLSETFGLRTGYRYFSTTGLEFSTGDFDADSHIVEVGIVAHF